MVCDVNRNNIDQFYKIVLSDVCLSSFEFEFDNIDLKYKRARME